jgi:hypothetical protein
MSGKLEVLAVAAVATGAIVMIATQSRANHEPNARGDTVIFVTSQGLYYDSVVNGPLPPHGKFQVLEMGPNGLQTEFGPGDPGYLGGRWMLDNGDGTTDYFSCPLLGPGRDNP